jgi:hypothetical protein
MPTLSFVTFPASGVKSGIDNILHSVSNHVVGKFPHRVIRAVFVDTRDKMRSIYMNLYTDAGGDKNKTTLHNVQEIRRIERPHLYVGYTIESFDTTETGLGEFPLLHYPNAYFLDEQMTSVFPILRDEKRNITLGTYNVRIRVTSEFLFSCQNKEEQITLYVYLKNFIKDKYGYILDGVKTKYTFPEVVLISLKNMLYGKEVSLKDVDKDLDIYLERNSNGGIMPVWRDGKENAKYYELEYIYQAIRFQLTGTPQLDDGDKKDMAYDNYTIRFPAIVEFYVPINYVLRSPELIPSAIGRPNLIDDFLVMDPVPDKDNNIQVLKIIKKYKDYVTRGYIDKSYYLVARDEFALEKREDYYDVRVALSEDYRAIFDSLLPEEKKACHKVYLYENDVPLDEGKCYDLDYSTWRVHIHNGDIEAIQMIEVYANIDLLNIFIKRQTRRDRIKGDKHARN